jgi:hypothetical protein
MAPWTTSTAINACQTTKARSRNMPGTTTWKPAHGVYSLHPDAASSFASDEPPTSPRFP